MRVVSVLVGIILLLPGLCSLGFMGLFVPEVIKEGSLEAVGPLGLLWLFCFAASYIGIVMIRGALRRNR